MKFSTHREIVAMREIRSLSASKYSQSQLLNQTLIFFDYFWSIEFSSIRATIISFKVYEIVSAQKLIRVRKELLLNEWSLDWSRRVESSRSSRVFDSSRLDSSQNSWLEYLSRIEMFDSSNRVESEEWNRVSTRNIRLDSSRHEDR